jgi:Ca2+-binding RTX toxin-like protein
MMTTITQKTMRRTALLFATMVLALVVFSGGALAVTLTCEAEVECFGTKRADTLNGSEGNDYIYSKGRGDTLSGFGGIDWLYGQGGADKLFGGPDVDHLIGGPGNDALSGGEDYDHYYFGSGWGKDSITDSTASSRNMVIFQDPANGHISLSDDLTIKLFPGEGPEVKNTSGTSTINWEEDAVQYVASGAGDDHITGSFLDNTIYGGEGADNISASVGDDTIYVGDGAGEVSAIEDVYPYRMIREMQRVW